MEKITVEFIIDEFERQKRRFAKDINIEPSLEEIKITKALKQLDNFEIGYRYAFWNDDKKKYIIDVYGGKNTDIDNKIVFPYMTERGHVYKHCTKIKKDAEF